MTTLLYSMVLSWTVVIFEVAEKLEGRFIHRGLTKLVSLTSLRTPKC